MLLAMFCLTAISLTKISLILSWSGSAAVTAELNSDRPGPFYKRLFLKDRKKETKLIEHQNWLDSLFSVFCVKSRTTKKIPITGFFKFPIRISKIFHTQIFSFLNWIVWDFTQKFFDSLVIFEVLRSWSKNPIIRIRDLIRNDFF